jgi:hypothetical protein
MNQIKQFFAKKKNLYLLLFVGFTFIMAFLPRFLAMNLYLFFSIYILGTFAINFWYGTQLKIHKATNITAALFSPVGFFFLLGYDEIIISEAELIEESYKLYKNNFKGLFKYSMLFFSFSILVVVVLSIMEIIQVKTGQVSGGLLGLFFLVRFILFCFGLLLSFALIRYISRIILKTKKVSLAHELHDTLPLFLPAILIYTIIFALIIPFYILGKNILFLVLIGIVFIWFIFVIHALVIENISVLQAFKKSKQLVQNRAWQILWRLSVGIGFYYVIAIIIRGIISLPFNVLLINFIISDSVWAIIVNNLFALSILFLTSIFIPIIMFIPPTILYFELRGKK